MQASLVPRARLPLLIVALGLFGCDDPPTCDIAGAIDGAITSEIAWSLEGEQSCGLADAAALSPDGTALVFLDGAAGSYQQFIVFVDSPELGVAEFPGQVLFVTPDDLWDSGVDTCTVVLTNYTVEPWSLVDFVQIEGIVNCAGPLVSASGGADITLTTMGITGHILDQKATFQNL